MSGKNNNNASELPNPQTLMEAVRVFADQDIALRCMSALRWPFGHVCCPRCGSERVRFIGTRRVWECREDHPCKRFSIKTGTVMEDSPLPLDTWLCGFWLEANAKNGISSYEVHRALGITQKSAWFMMHRVRLAMQTGSFTKMGGSGGTVEADETFIGGKARNMHKDRRARVIIGTGVAGKTAVMGLLDRHSEKGKSKVRTFVVSNTKRKTLTPIVREHVEAGTNVYTDSLASYTGLAPDFAHDFVNHAEMYVKDNVHTNGLENFWALFKRCIKGTHVSIEPFHTFRYLDAEAFRFNNRADNDGGRFIEAVKGIGGKRLTYKRLIGENESGERIDDGNGEASESVPMN
ncbi:MAG TPA: IS1595 family transposase [Tepidisphaeraceae bacterium]|nr:IS1595 family transposase [Tepidisphaeraceae bacterium]